MKIPIFKRYPNLLSLLAIITLAFSLVMLGAPVITGIAIVALFQLSQFALSVQRPALFMAALTDAQVREFEQLCGDLKTVPEKMKGYEKEIDDLRGQLRTLRKSSAGSIGSSGSGIRWVGNKPFVSEDCAEALCATMVAGLGRSENGLERMCPDGSKRQRILDKAKSILGAEYKAALDPTSTPLPTIYSPQISELVWKYGQARQYATVFPLGAGTVKLPRLKAGEDDFGYLGVGTAGMSQAVGEKKVTAELVTFTANKAGGIIRIPFEIEEDTFIQIGQFLARYIARQLAKLEDKTLFLGDGTSTYANIVGIGNYCTTNAAYLQQLGAGKTKPTDAALSDFRAMRGKVNAAVYADEPAYYLNPTMEALLVTFNTIGTPLIYKPANGDQPATLDGFPIHWCGVLQPYSTLATASAFLGFFGALTYWYLGERGAPRVEISRDVYFASDELAMRALERIDVEGMAIDAMATLQTAAA